MPSLGKLRRTWFALVRESGIEPDDRHAVQEALTGKASTKNWTPADFERAIAEQQRTLGQHNDRRAHVRNDEGAGRAGGPKEVPAGTWATPRQADYIADLVARTEWRVSPLAYLSHNVLAGPEKALRREQLKQRFASVGSHGPELWIRLTRQEASDAVKAFEKASRSYPRDCVAQAPSPAAASVALEPETRNQEP